MLLLDLSVACKLCCRLPMQTSSLLIMKTPSLSGPLKAWTGQQWQLARPTPRSCMTCTCCAESSGLMLLGIMHCVSFENLPSPLQLHLCKKCPLRWACVVASYMHAADCPRTPLPACTHRIWSCAAVVSDAYGNEQLVGFITAKTALLHEVDPSVSRRAWLASK